MSTYRSLPIEDTGEPLVPVSAQSSKIKVYPFYYYQNIPSALKECYLREGVVERLIDAAEKLPKNLHFVVLDGWRPFDVQLALFKMIGEGFRKEGLEESSVQQKLSTFVAYPSNNPNTPSPHMTGGAVDLTIACEEGWLDMGTEFDEFSEKAHMDWYEKQANLTEQERLIVVNRKLLKQVMHEAGFTNYKKEWWHFDYGNQSWSMMKNLTAFYKGVVR